MLNNGEMVVGLGIDLVEVAEVARLIADPAGHFLRRCFTENERAALDASPLSAQRAAGHFAAKEAVVKALGTGWGDGIAWTDIEVHTAASGTPFIVLSGSAAAAASHITRWLVSISHTATYATAVAIALHSSLGSINEA